jgi:hypothetical protein
MTKSSIYYGKGETDNEHVKPLTMAEFCSLDFPKRDWHGWKLRGCVLSYRAYGNGGEYPVDLEHFAQSPARLLDIIFQVQSKTWATRECVKGLLNALQDLIHPQSTLCSMGKAKELTAKQIRERVRESK